MAFITINSGATDIQPGTYTVILTEISDPKLVVAKSGPRAGEEVELIEWTFSVDEGDFEGTTLRDSSTTSSGPKSKLFGWVTALLGGKPPAPGQPFEKADLIGRRALAKVILNDSGWPKVDTLVALPASKPRVTASAPAVAVETEAIPF